MSMITEAPSLLLPVADKNYCIRFITDAEANPSIPVNFIAGADGNYTLDFTGISGFANIYLQDLKTGTMQNLKTQPTYSFAAKTSDEAGRFILRFTALGIDNAKAGDKGIHVYNNVLSINNPGTSVVTVYSMVGQKVAETRTNGEAVYQTRLDLNTGYYIVNVTDGNKAVSEKVFIK
jgi:hypothetical protein